MQQKQIIVNSINNLVQIELNKGVQPYELVKNISSEGYQSIETKKINNTIICDVTFEDEDFFTDKKIICCYRYTYDETMNLIEISDVSKRYCKVIWSREDALKEAIREIISSMGNLSITDQERLINNLPINLKEVMKKSYKQTS